MDMKSRGMFVSRQLSFHGCSFEMKRCELRLSDQALYERQGGKWPPPCLTTTPPPPARCLLGLGPLLGTPERRLSRLEACRGLRSSPQAGPTLRILPFSPPERLGSLRRLRSPPPPAPKLDEAPLSTPRYDQAVAFWDALLTGLEACAEATGREPGSVTPLVEKGLHPA